MLPVNLVSDVARWKILNVSTNRIKKHQPLSKIQCKLGASKKLEYSHKEKGQ